MDNLKEQKNKLKDQARALGISFSPNIGIAKLQEKIDAHKQSTLNPAEILSNANNQMFADINAAQERDSSSETLTEFEKAEKEAMAMVRCNIICHNAEKMRNMDGEIFTISNAVIRPVARFVPYGIPECAENWHLPRILVNFLKEKTYRAPTERRRANKRENFTNQFRIVPEFTIVELPPYTKEELETLKRKQALNEGL